MVQKRHQGEISGPLDSVNSAPLASDLTRPKRERFRSLKVVENDAQSELQLIPIHPRTSERRPIPRADNASPASLERPSKRQKRINQNAQVDTQSSQSAEWEAEFNGTTRKVEKLEILAEHIGPIRPYPEKLNIPIPSTPGRPVAKVTFTNPLALFHRFIPKDLFPTIAEHTNQYAL